MPSWWSLTCVQLPNKYHARFLCHSRWNKNGITVKLIKWQTFGESLLPVSLRGPSDQTSHPFFKLVMEVTPWVCLPCATWTSLPFRNISSLLSHFYSHWWNLQELLLTRAHQSPCCWSPVGWPPLQEPTLICAHVLRVPLKCSEGHRSSFPITAEIAAPNLLKPSLWSQYFPDIWEKLWV